ncbi:MAG: hypothetical protein Q8L27_04665, partial [archaeon]|nr:hypothetical protein [archaeon]
KNMKKIHININEKYKKYLPSKKFTYVVLTFIGTGILVFIISTLLFGKNSFFSKENQNKLATQKLTINELLQKDSDGDGVMDWEEGLWGTDPNNTKTFNDMPDAEYVKSKREALKTPGGNGLDNSSLTETDKFAQQFFASIAALKQNGQIDTNTINNISSTLGQNIVDPTIIDKYNNQDAKINGIDSIESQKTYYLTIKNLFTTYSKKGLGNETEITGTLASSGITAEEKTKYTNQLAQIADAYQEYAQKIIETQVPRSLISYHIAIANSANNTGIAVRNMTKVTDDPIVGLSGLSQYQKYSEDLISSVGNLESVLYNNGIIVE